MQPLPKASLFPAEQALFNTLWRTGSGPTPPINHDTTQTVSHEPLELGYKHYRAIFISDLHLGTPGCQAQALLSFIKANSSDYLYLIGDIVDGWQLRRRWYWPESHNDVVQKLLRRARKGCRIIYVPGNHDEFARGFFGHQFGGIEVSDDAVHLTADGQRLWVTHGDAFDGVIQCAKWLAYLGDNLYEFTLKLNRYLNHWRAKLGLPYWSLSAYLKHKVKKAMMYVADFEEALAHEAKRRGHHGVVCGHIHRAEMRQIDGILYCNDGDWVESCTALVEHHDGRLELVRWAPTHTSQNQPNSAAACQTV
jgi:UDP-2,3-diacylglucosamine pyrophosphatase LpxH